MLQGFARAKLLQPLRESTAVLPETAAFLPLSVHVPLGYLAQETCKFSGALIALLTSEGMNAHLMPLLAASDVTRWTPPVRPFLLHTLVL